MIFSKEELRKEIPISKENMLSIEDLLNDFSVTNENKILFPIGKVEYESFNLDTNKYEIVKELVYSPKDIKGLKITLDTLKRNKLMIENRKKYILGYENITNNFPYFGHKALENNEHCRIKNLEIQNYLIKNNVKVITVSHENCGYDYRGGEKELLSRDYADFVCDGTNDTEILQKAINMYPNENVLILLLEDEYVLKPVSGDGTDKKPYICLNINRDNIIIRSCDRKTNLTFDRNIVNTDDKVYIVNSIGKNVDISNINLALEELNIHYVEYAYPNPTDKMIEVKEYVESIESSEKQFNKKMIIELFKENI